MMPIESNSRYNVKSQGDRQKVPEDGHANRTTNKMFVPHQLRRVRLGP